MTQSDGVDTLRLRISWPAAPASQGYNGRMWLLRGWEPQGSLGQILPTCLQGQAPRPTRPMIRRNLLTRVPATSLSPSKPGYHRYTANNVVASGVERVTVEEMRDQVLRFAVLGRSPDQPVVSGQIYPVYDPVTGMFVGNVRTTVSADGLTTVNRTLPGHLLADGAVIRTAIHNPDGSWTIKSTGIGNSRRWERAWPGLSAHPP